MAEKTNMEANQAASENPKKGKGKKTSEKVDASPITKPDSSSEVQNDAPHLVEVQNSELLSVNSSPERDGTTLLPPEPTHPFSNDIYGSLPADPLLPPGYKPIFVPRSADSSTGMVTAAATGKGKSPNSKLKPTTSPVKTSLERGGLLNSRCWVSLLHSLLPFVPDSQESLGRMVEAIINKLEDGCPPWALLTFHEDMLIYDKSADGKGKGAGMSGENPNIAGMIESAAMKRHNQVFSLGDAGLMNILLWVNEMREWQSLIEKVGVVEQKGKIVDETSENFIIGDDPFLTKVCLLNIIEKMVKNSKEKNIETMIGGVFGWSEILTYWPKGYMEGITQLKRELEDFTSLRIKKKKTVVLFEDLIKLAVEQPQEVEAISEATYELILSSPQTVIKTFQTLQNALISTTPTHSGNKQLELYHPLYPTKRIIDVPLNKLPTDLWGKILMAERQDLIKIIYTFEDGSKSLLQSLPKQLLSNLPEPLPALLTSILLPQDPQSPPSTPTLPSFIPPALLSLFTHTLPLPQLYRSTFHTIANYHNLLCSAVPVSGGNELVGPLMTSIAFKTSIKFGAKSAIWARVRGAQIDGYGEIKGGDSEDTGVVDVEYEEGIIKVLESAWPNCVVIEASNSYGVRIAKTIKEIVGRIVVESRNTFKMPTFVMKKIEVSELRAFTLSDKAPKLDFMHLIAYSMACYPLDPLAECLKLRFSSKEVPNFKIDLVKQLDPNIKLKIWDFVLQQRLTFSTYPASVYSTHKPRYDRYLLEHSNKKYPLPFLEPSLEDTLPKDYPENLAKSISDVFKEANKHNSFIRKYVSMLDSRVRGEDSSILYLRVRDCPITKEFFAKTSLPICLGSFLKILQAIRRAVPGVGVSKGGDGEGGVAWPSGGDCTEDYGKFKGNPTDVCKRWYGVESSYLENWKEYLQVHRAVRLELMSIEPKLCRGRIFSALPVTASFSDLKNEKGKPIDPKTIQSILLVGSIFDCKIIDINYDTNIIRVSLNLKADDVRRFIYESKILSKYQLFDQNNFKISLTEDHPYVSPWDLAQNKQDLNQVTFPRSCNHPFFKNLGLFSARSQLLVPSSFPNPGFLIPNGEHTLTLLIKISDNILIEETVEEIEPTQGPNGKLRVKGEEYFGVNGIKCGYVDRILEILSTLQNDPGWVWEGKDPAPRAEIGSDLKYSLCLSRDKPGFGILSTCNPSRSLHQVLQEYFQLSPGFINFHGKEFYHAQEMIGWCKNNLTSSSYSKGCMLVLNSKNSTGQMVDELTPTGDKQQGDGKSFSFMKEATEHRPASTEPQQRLNEVDIGVRAGGSNVEYAERGTDPSEAWFLGKRMPKRDDFSGEDRRGGYRGRGGDRGRGGGNFDRPRGGGGGDNDRGGQRGRGGGHSSFQDTSGWDKKDDFDWKSKPTGDSSPAGWGKKPQPGQESPENAWGSSRNTEPQNQSWGDKKPSFKSDSANWGNQAKSNEDLDTDGWSKPTQSPKPSNNNDRPNQAEKKDSLNWEAKPQSSSSGNQTGTSWEKKDSDANEGWGKPAAETNDGWSKPASSRDAPKPTNNQKSRIEPETEKANSPSPAGNAQPSWGQSSTQKEEVSTWGKSSNRDSNENEGGWNKTKISPEKQDWKKPNQPAPASSSPQVVKQNVKNNEPEEHSWGKKKESPPKAWGKASNTEEDNGGWSKKPISDEPADQGGWNKSSKPSNDNQNKFQEERNDNKSSPNNREPRSSPSPAWGKPAKESPETKSGWNKTPSKPTDQPESSTWGKQSPRQQEPQISTWGKISSTAADAGETSAWGKTPVQHQSSHSNEQGEREEGGWGQNREERGGWRGNRGDRGGDRGGWRGDRGDRGGDRGGWRGDRGDRSDRGDRGGFRGDRGGERGGWRGDRGRDGFRGSDRNEGGFKGRDRNEEPTFKSGNSWGNNPGKESPEQNSGWQKQSSVRQPSPPPTPPPAPPTPPSNNTDRQAAPENPTPQGPKRQYRRQRDD
jgi:hypothetical protein